MADSFSKKEKEKKRMKARQDKAQKMQERKESNSGGKSLEDMMAYVDEDGNIVSTPPDPNRKREDNAELALMASEGRPVLEEPAALTGIISFYNDEKGYGFITQDQTRDNIFVHANQATEALQKNDRVTFEREKTPRGFNALQVKKIK